ncbi:DEAD/DEAH box helicase family protein [Vibrio parahaemolyticus]|nr:DEAD/DEAH box helicase family protein [Vibrio parahaemolyticus]MBM5002114.1 DEAD/DEAH box helicase family protein [Vibrio parahaemolyticus]
MSSVRMGSFVKSSTAFSGVGKIVSINTQKKEAEVSFFHSPQKPFERTISVHASDLKLADLQLQSIVFCRLGDKQRWKQGFFDGFRPDGLLVKFNSSYSDVFDLEDIFVPSLDISSTMNPQDFLKAKCTVSPMLTEMRNEFFDTYIDQRIACESIPALLGSAVELESHQLAVVNRVLSDDRQKYLLCDEVGLGKTIEAGLILRNHINEKGRDARVFVVTPPSLVNQWKQELESRFNLGDILDLATESSGENFDPELIIYIGEYKDIIKLNAQIENVAGIPNGPTMLIVDESHNLSKLAWSDKMVEKFIFDGLVKASDCADCTLLLTGTPLVGREKDYLAMLHCLEPQKYPLTEEGVELFKESTHHQAKYVSLYRGLDPNYDDDDIENVVEQIEELGLNDQHLEQLVEEVKPLVDFFNDDEVDQEVRDKAVLSLRHYFGEKYTTNYRMLRNRRDSSNGALHSNSINNLFPGLSQSQTISWNLPSTHILLDEQLDDLRGMQSVIPSKVLTEEKYLSWVAALMLSPQFFAHKVQTEAIPQSMSDEEREYWLSMLEVANLEQIAKDNALLEAISDWKEQYPSGKVVVFCGNESVANNVFNKLSTTFNSAVERHVAGNEPKFVTEQSVSILVCDQHGEDGLNLQGKIRLAIHYSLPLELNRIEQRNGRLNRYSAQNRGAYPVQNMIMLPARDGFYKGWGNVLRDGIGTFEHYRASIQEPIDKYLRASWSKVWLHGYPQLHEMSTELSGPQGLVRRELNSLELQDAMNRDTLDVRASVRFSERIKMADERFDESSTHFFNWIKHGLLFNPTPSDIPGSFTLSFNQYKTRVNVNNLIKHCVIGFDFENSNYQEPKTYPMSLERTQCAQSGAYPFRIGQPFVDSIYKLSQELPYGISSALIRSLNSTIEPHLFFKAQWLSTYVGDDNNQLRNDRISAPMIQQYIYQSNGIEASNIHKQLLNAPYSKQTKSVDVGDIVIDYKDINISVEKHGNELIDIWQFVEQQFTQTNWELAIDNVCQESEEKQTQSYIAKNSNIDPQCVSNQLVSLQAILLVGS